MIEPLEEAEALLHKVYILAEEKSDIEDFGSAFFDDFEEANRDFAEVKGNHAFLNKNLLSNNDLDQNSDWEDFFQIPHHQIEYASYESNNDTPMDIDDINQPRSYKS